MRKAVLIPLLILLILLTSCGGRTYRTIWEYIGSMNDLTRGNIGTIDETETVNPNTISVTLRDNLKMTIFADAATGYIFQVDLTLSLQDGPDSLEYNLFEDYFLIMIRAYFPGIGISSLNSIRESLGIGSYVPGTASKIGYGSSTYYYTVTEEEAVFTAEFEKGAETLAP
ncbi:MAG: hypothetical protein J5938_03650 [Clostridia bacterium]|nr:hypothetical protein [Clostridia bacterium]